MVTHAMFIPVSGSYNETDAMATAIRRYMFQPIFKPLATFATEHVVRPHVRRKCTTQSAIGNSMIRTYVKCSESSFRCPSALTISLLL